MKTYLSKTNTMGNRLQLTVDDEKKVYCMYGCHFGYYGEVEDEMLQREVKLILNDCKLQGYKEVKVSELREVA